MSDKSAISWTDATWNVLLGCDRVSPGCDGCYAIGNARIRESNPNPKVAGPYAGLVEERDGRIDWTGRVTLVEDRLDLPLRWSRPRRIFVNAQSDLFHDAVSDETIARIFAVMAIADRHVFQVLTKRHGRMRSLLSDPAFAALVNREYCCYPSDVPSIRGYPWPLPNVWLGVSVEDQKRADLRIPALLDTPAAVRILSCEPLLGPLDLARYVGQPGHRRTHLTDGFWHDSCPACRRRRRSGGTGAVDWVIVGGESGPHARPMHPEWLRQLRDQCVAAGVPFHFKQWGEWGRGGSLRPEGRRRAIAAADGRAVSLVGDDVEIRMMWLYGGASVLHRVGRKAAGRELDGRTWDEYPPDRETVAP